MGDEIKVGNRNSTDDRRRIRETRAHAREIDRLTRELEPEDEDTVEMMKTGDALVTFGTEVKALDGGRVAGYLVRFSGADDPDLTGDFFTRETDFDMSEGAGATVYYNHGLDAKMGRRKIGAGSLRVDDVGVWIEAQLNERDEYERAIFKLAREGKLGWSSGTASHLVERESSGKAYRITRWPLGVDASLTPTPAEPRNAAVVPLKSLTASSALLDVSPETEGEPQGAGDAPGSEVEEVKSTNLESLITGGKMDENEIKTMVMAAADAAAAKAVEEFKKSLPVVNPAGHVEVTRDEADQPWRNAGEFFKAVRVATADNRSEDARLRAMKANGLAGEDPSAAGYLVPPQFAGGIIERTYSIGALLSRVAVDSVTGNRMVYNAVDETSRVSGSQYGGITAYWVAEGGSITASKPKFRQVDLKLKKIVAAAYATDELLEDASALEGWLTRTVPNVLRFEVENAVYRGDGVGKPLGIMNSPCLVSVTRDTGSAIKVGDVVGMWSRRYGALNDYVWLINQDAAGQLPQMTISNMPVYIPAGGLSGSQYGSLFGRPVIEVEYASSLNTTGDIMLASLSQYQMIQKAGVQSASSMHVAFLTDEMVFRFTYRCDGEPLWNSALTPAQGSNTQSPFVVLGSAT